MKKSIIFLLFLSVLSLTGCGPEFYYNNGKKALEKGNYTKAVDYFNKAGNYNDTVNLLDEAIHLKNVSLDEVAPQIVLKETTIVLHKGESFDVDDWLKKNIDSITDDISAQEDIRCIAGNAIDTNIVGEDQMLMVEVYDEAGNTSVANVSVTIKDINPVKVAYDRAISLVKSEIYSSYMKGDYLIDGIVIPNRFDSAPYADKLNQGTLYRVYAEKLLKTYDYGTQDFEYWYKNEANKILNESSIVSRYGADMVDSIIDYVSEIVCPHEDPVAEIIYRISKSKYANVKMDIENHEADIEIHDLQKVASDLLVSDELFGYMLALLDEFGAAPEFDGDSYRCHFKLLRQFELNESDFIATKDGKKENYLTNKDSDLNLLLRNVNGNDTNNMDIDYCQTTYRGIHAGHSKESVQFMYGNSTIKKFGKSKDPVYKLAKDDGVKWVTDNLSQAETYTVYNYKKNQLIFYFDSNDKVIGFCYIVRYKLY